MERKETFEVKQVHDNDKYIVKQTFVEEMDGKTLMRNFHQIAKASREMQQQLNDIPVQVKSRTETFEKELGILKARMDKIMPFTKKLAQQLDEIEKQEAEKAKAEQPKQ